MSTAWPLRVVVAGGGTGGHLFPGLAVARALLERRPDARVSFVGTRRGLEARVVPREGFELDFIRSAGLKGKSPLDLMRGVLLMLPGFWEAWRIIRRRRPRVVIGVGGYSSGPVVLAAALQRRPTLVLEQNAIPGLTNRLLARVVRAAAVTYDDTRSHFGPKAFVSGNPVRPAFFTTRAVAESRTPSSGAGVTSVLIFGGSQGAHALNVAVMEALPALGAVRLAITHQTGDRDLESVRAAYARVGLHARVEPFLFEMEQAMFAADLVVCRAGATTLAELAAVGRPAVLVPLPIATDDHQRHNAEILERAGAAEVLEQKRLSGASLASVVTALAGDPERLKQMAERMRSFAAPDAARLIAERIMALADE